MLRRQREAALTMKRRSQMNEMPPVMQNISNRPSTSLSSHRPSTSSSSSHRRGSFTNAMVDVMAWDEIKTKERIQNWLQDEAIRREEESKAEKQRREELAMFEQEQQELEQRLAEEQKIRLEEESRRLGQADRLAKERMDMEAANTRAQLKRLEEELKQEHERAKLEADKLAQQRKIEEEMKIMQRRRSQVVDNASGEEESQHTSTLQQRHLPNTSTSTAANSGNSNEEAYGHIRMKKHTDTL
jgi:hypothetical protein